MHEAATSQRDPPARHGLARGRVGGRHPRLQALFAEYGEAHRHPANRVCHEVAIPAIVLTLVAMLDWVPLGEVAGHPVTLALPALAAAAAWYVWMDVALGVGMAALLAACLPLGRALAPAAVFAVAALAWTLQFIGHFAFERRQPSFFTNLVHALVGPVYFLGAMVDLGRTAGRP